MNRLAVIALALFALLPATVLAQQAQQTPSNQYNDPAMSFTAPTGFKPLPVPSHDPAQFDNPAVMAAYASTDPSNPATITLRMDSFQGDLDAWATTSDNNLRSSTDGAFIKRTATKLSNGMPAYWEEITAGTGFDQIKSYQLLWADGVRGVTLSIIARSGALDDAKARAILSNVTAVAYPRYRY